jgi:hypothetical protein
VKYLRIYIAERLLRAAQVVMPDGCYECMSLSVALLWYANVTPKTLPVWLQGSIRREVPDV